MRNESLSPAQMPQEGVCSPRTLAPEARAALTDKFGRRISYLRLSVTDRCDFRCTYCMAEDMVFSPRQDILSLEEALTLVKAFAALGVRKVRITGGEPLVRRNILWLLEHIARVDGVQELVLTTNGSQLERFAPALVQAGVKRVNISLDTLNAERFRAITRIGELDKVLRGIDAARSAGFAGVKLNTVLMRGFNDGELLDLTRFALERDIDLAFIEEMPLGDIGRERSNTWLSALDALTALQTEFPLVATDESTGGPARYWRIPGRRSKIGFITPHSDNFCDSCNRVRITARGELYPCLGQNDAVALLPLLRESSAQDQGMPAEQRLQAAIMQSMGIKPWGHDFTTQLDAPKVVRFMSATGG